MKLAPIRPPKKPITIAANILSNVGAKLLVAASLITSELLTLITSRSSYNYLKTLSTKVLIVEAKNTFQVSEKDQKVFGFEIS